MALHESMVNSSRRFRLPTEKSLGSFSRSLVRASESMVRKGFLGFIQLELSLHQLAKLLRLKAFLTPHLTRENDTRGAKSALEPRRPS